MKWNHAAGTDCFSAPSLNTILFRSARRGEASWWVNRKDSPSAGRQHRFSGEGRARKLFFCPDRCSLFKLIRTCLRNNWKRDFGLDFSCEAELRAVPLSHHRHCLPSLLIITYLLDTLLLAFSAFFAQNIGNCGRPVGGNSGSACGCRFSHHRQWKMKIEKFHKPVGGSECIILRIRQALAESVVDVSLCLHAKTFLTENILIAISCDSSWWGFYVRFLRRLFPPRDTLGNFIKWNVN